MDPPAEPRGMARGGRVPSGVLLPLGTDRYKRRPTLVTYVLIAANLAVYGGFAIWAQSDANAAGRWQGLAALTPGRSAWWTYVTYAFLHANLAHILFNMLALWVFGPDVEDRLGRIGFAALYLAGAIGSGVAHAQFSANPVVGASGAIAAVTGAFLVFFPYVHVRTLVFFFIIGVYHITAWWFIAFAIAADLFNMARGGGNVAHFAHVGGYVLGIAVAMGLLAAHIVPREPYDLFTIGRQAARRRAFKAAHAEAQRPRPVERRSADVAVTPPDGPASQARLRVQEQLARGDAPGAAASYLEMRKLPGAAQLPPLGRRQLYEVANQLFQSGDHVNAADAYRLFLSAYEHDSEAPRVLLMLGLINARFLNDPTEAKRMLTGAVEKLGSDEETRLAKEILEEIG